MGRAPSSTPMARATRASGSTAARRARGCSSCERTRRRMPPPPTLRAHASTSFAAAARLPRPPCPLEACQQAVRLALPVACCCATPLWR
eukprot:3363019-Prymnesium_polylepis.1